MTKSEEKKEYQVKRKEKEREREKEREKKTGNRYGYGKRDFINHKSRITWTACGLVKVIVNPPSGQVPPPWTCNKV